MKIKSKIFQDIMDMMDQSELEDILDMIAEKEANKIKLVAQQKADEFREKVKQNKQNKYNIQKCICIKFIINSSIPSFIFSVFSAFINNILIPKL